MTVPSLKDLVHLSYNITMIQKLWVCFYFFKSDYLSKYMNRAINTSNNSQHSKIGNMNIAYFCRFAYAINVGIEGENLGRCMYVHRKKIGFSYPNIHPHFIGHYYSFHICTLQLLLYLLLYQNSLSLFSTTALNLHFLKEF